VFEQYSDRARAIVFVARYRSGKDGAAAMDTDHLIEAIIFEDQGKLADALDKENLLSPIFEPKPHFFSEQFASELLMKIQQMLPHQDPIPTSVDMPVSADLARTFEVAKTLMEDLNHRQVEPLHLLAAALSEQSEAAKFLSAVGVTSEHVLTALKADLSKP